MISLYVRLCSFSSLWYKWHYFWDSNTPEDIIKMKAAQAELGFREENSRLVGFRVVESCRRRPQSITVCCSQINDRVSWMITTLSCQCWHDSEPLRSHPWGVKEEHISAPWFPSSDTYGGVFWNMFSDSRFGVKETSVYSAASRIHIIRTVVSDTKYDYLSQPRNIFERRTSLCGTRLSAVTLNVEETG